MSAPELRAIEDMQPHDIHITRSSDRAAKRVCTRMWDWRYRQGWVPTVEPQALEFGQAMHCGLQVIYEPSTWDSTIERKLKAGIDAFTASCKEQSDRYLIATSQPRRTGRTR